MERDQTDRRYWSESYETFLARRETAEAKPGADKRAHARFQVCRNIMWSNGDLQFVIVDLSASGIAFDCNERLEAGQPIVLKLSDLVKAHAIVVRTEQMSSTPVFYLQRYRVCARFEDELEGMKFLVLVADIREIRIDT